MRTLLALLLVASTVLPSYAEDAVVKVPQGMIKIANDATRAGPHAGTPTKWWNPPAEYDKPYPHGWRTVFLNRWQILDICGKHAAACAAFPAPGFPCTIYLPELGMLVNGFRIDEPGQLRMLRHEMGHCNGWGPNHPGVINPFTGKMGG